MRRLDVLLKENAALRAIEGHVSKLAEIQNIWNSIVPQTLRQFTRVGGVKHRRITVFADNGAVAAKLKLLSPGLLKTLQNKGLEVTSIRVEVQVKSVRGSASHAPRRLSSAAAESLQQLAKSLPDSPLRAALERLARKN